LRRLPLLPLLTFCMLLIIIASPQAFAKSTISVTITLQGLPANLSTNVYINGNYNQTLAGGASTTYTLSANNSYAISIDSYVQGSISGSRYYCQNAALQTNSSGNRVFTYVPQYFLTVQTAYGSSSGQGWYTSGVTAYATVSDQQLPEEEGTRNIFTGWSGDANGTQLTSNGITMNGPKVAVADWATQFYLSVDSEPGNATGLAGSGWYDSGTQANFTAPGILPVASNTRLEFDHWSGEFTGEQPVGSVIMDRPKTVTANYLPQYLLAVYYSPESVTGYYNETHAGWYDTNSDVQLGPAPAIINLSSVDRLQFAGWSDNGSTYNNLSYTLLVNAPRNVTLSYKAQYYLDVQSTYGAASGSGWYDNASTATINAPTSAGTWPITYTLTGWTVNPPTQAAVDDGGSWTIIVNGPYTVRANWSMNYFPLILLFAVAGTTTTVGVGVAVGYKRGGLGRKASSPPIQKTAQTPIVTDTVPEPSNICAKCGKNLPDGAAFCEECGTAVDSTRIHEKDDLVYDYIVNHGGVISITAASKELGLPVGTLKEVTERLKREGRLS